MPGRNDLKRHAQLVDDMATTLGLDLEEAAMRGKLAISQIEDAVLSCTMCTQPETCARWLASRPKEPDTAPTYCRNTTLFEDLRRT
ncbi:DUF6455 family protein [Salipiger mucosus]|uniref:DUF6455 domain-containing protein n=1 Tax=Salipiger mucosus DSM 16094 TaxID=1123237 RepID=S9S0P6_9RHOB|nr:DUF6455 family protein [Salipiger mucosus]EPX79809.1 hypothetical protein Salmuc_02571 [Salipiger mucosus DSM 16094]